MPNVLTHGLMAQQIKKQLSEQKILAAMDAHQDVYLFASNGPDFLFYYNVWPWLDQKRAKEVGDHGELMHHEKINEFIDTMIAIAQKQDNEKNKQIMIAFIAGYLCHWALDSVAHPFVFYRSGDLKGKQKYDHYRYESAIDSKIVQLVYQQKLSKYPTYKFMNMKPYQEKVVAFLVSHAHQKVYQSTLTKQECLTCMKHAKQVLRVLFDPYDVLYPIMRTFEKIIHKEKTPFTSHMVRATMNHYYDELNMDREAWFNPTDPSEVHHESFMQLFEQSIGRAKLALKALDKMLDNQLDSIGNVVLDRSFDTDRADHAAMIVFDNIYRK